MASEKVDAKKAKVQIVSEQESIIEKDSAIKETHWDEKSWTISGILLTLWAAIFFGVCSLNELPLWKNVLISIGVLIGLFFIIWVFRRHLLLAIKQLDRIFRFKRTWNG